MRQELTEKIIALRHMLHSCAEPSGQEHRTRALLWEFLRENTGMELHSCGDGFYAAFRKGGESQNGILLRADYDGLSMPDGRAKHLCGHDGHAAALCAAALLLEEQPVNRNVFFLFQPAEETGTGAEGCTEIFTRERVVETYGTHNLPGFPLGQIVTREGTFACASEGLIIYFLGKAAHAAYPEQGISPAEAVGCFLCRLPELTEASGYRGMTLCTVVAVKLGERAFGTAASNAEICLTLRAEHDCDLDLLREKVLLLAVNLAKKYGLKLSHERQDVFIATENDPICAEKVLRLCKGTELREPMRWSEDFGQYLLKCPGAFFGIGAGTAHPPLHSEHYEYPDDLLMPTAQAFLKLIQE